MQRLLPATYSDGRGLPREARDLPSARTVRTERTKVSVSVSVPVSVSVSVS